MGHLRCIPGVLENNQIVTVQTNGPLLFVFAKQILHNVHDAQTAMMTAFGKQFGHPSVLKSSQRKPTAHVLSPPAEEV